MLEPYFGNTKLTKVDNIGSCSWLEGELDKTYLQYNSQSWTEARSPKKGYK